MVGPQNTHIDLQAENNALLQRIAELEQALATHQRQCTCLQQELVWADILTLKDTFSQQHILSTFAASTPVLCIIRDCAGRCLYTNSFFNTSFQLAPEYPLGKPYDELFPEHITTKHSQADHEVITTGKTVTFEESHVLDDGEYTYLTTIFPISHDAEIVAVGAISVDISERVRAEEALRKSEERFRNIADFAYDWEYWVDMQGNYLYVSPSCERITGYTAEEFYSIPGLFGSIVHLDDCGSVAWHLEESVTNPRAISLTFRIITKQGEERWVGHVSQPVYDRDGHLIGHRASNRDITDQVLAEERLRESEERYRAMANNISDLITRNSPDGTYFYVSPACTSILGYEPETLVGTNCYELVHPRDIDVVQHSHHILEQGAQEFTSTYRLLHKGGYYIWLESIAKAVYDAGGQELVEIVSVARDITERKRIEKELEENRSRLSAIFDNAMVGIGVMDTNGHYIHVNKRWADMLGHSLEEIYHTTYLNITHPDDVRRSYHQFHQLRHGVIDSYCMETRFVRKDRSVFWGDLSVRAIQTATGRVDAIVSIITNITERKHAEEMLCIQRDMAIALSSMGNLHDSLNRLLEICFHLEGIDCGGVYMVDPKSKDLNLIVHKGVSQPFAEHVSFYPANSLNARLARKKSVQYFTLATMQDFADHVYQQEGLHSIAMVPVINENHLVAVIILASHTHDQIPQEARATINSIAPQIGGIIARVRTEEALRESEQRLQILFDTLDDFLIVFDVDGHILHCNPVVQRRLGYTEAELLSKHIINIYPPDRRYEALEIVLAMLVGRESVSDIPLMTSGGTIIPVQTRVTRGAWGNCEVFFSISRDITELKKIEQELQQTNQQLTRSIDELKQRNRDIVLLNEMGDSLHHCHSVENSYEIIRPYLVKLFNEQSGALYIQGEDGVMRSVIVWGEYPFDVDCPISPECYVLKHYQECVVDGSERQIPCKCPLTGPKEQETADSPYLCIPLSAQSNMIGILHIRIRQDCVRSLRDFWKELATTTASKLGLELVNLQMQERLHNQAIRDPLTGLFNRRYLDETLQRELQRASRANYAVGVIMIDIDHFKDFNDTYGHDGGDTLLRAVGNFLQSHSRGDDIACRYGGEEFTLIFPGASLEETHTRAEQFRLRLKQLNVQHNGTPLRTVTASMGIACYPLHGSTDEVVMKAADSALYRAKQEGRDRVVEAKYTPPQRR